MTAAPGDVGEQLGAGVVAGVAGASRGGGQEAPHGQRAWRRTPRPKGVAWQEGRLVCPVLSWVVRVQAPLLGTGVGPCELGSPGVHGQRAVSSLAPPRPLCRRRPARSRPRSGWTALSRRGARVPHGRSVPPGGEEPAEGTEGPGFPPQEPRDSEHLKTAAEAAPRTSTQPACSQGEARHGPGAGRRWGRPRRGTWRQRGRAEEKGRGAQAPPLPPARVTLCLADGNGSGGAEPKLGHLAKE